ncbi:MAG: membrane protein insertion efficiency factor YidD [Kiritimatiellaceae bacterium]|nr:membrane protein insertion efficiency factor YidD [Kiritimatiellaceae bacterium]
MTTILNIRIQRFVPDLIVGIRICIKKLLILLVWLYQKTISKVTPASCRFYPTCSDYTIEALQKHGIVAGLYLCLRRILRCHPWNPGGVDPVPEVGMKGSENRKQKPD